MGITIQTTNAPDDAPLIEVDEAEFIDLQRMGLIKPGKGDVNSQGKLKRDVAAEAAPEVLNVTGQVPTVTNQGGQQ